MRISDWSSDVCSSDLATCAVKIAMGRRMFKSILRRPLLPLFALPLLLAPVPLPAQTGGAPYSIDGRGFSRLQDAVDAIGEGEGTIRIAPGHHRDRSEEPTSELQSLMRLSYAVFCLKK